MSKVGTSYECISQKLQYFFPAELLLTLKISASTEGCSIASLKPYSFRSLQKSTAENAANKNSSKNSSTQTSFTKTSAAARAFVTITKQGCIEESGAVIVKNAAVNDPINKKSRNSEQQLAAQQCAKTISTKLQNYFNGDAAAISQLQLFLPEVIVGKAKSETSVLASWVFSKKVLTSLLENVPVGSIISYSQLGDAACNNGVISRGGYARAVGGVVASNPITIVVPCHRVVSKKMLSFCGHKNFPQALAKIGAGSYGVRNSGGEYSPLKTWLLALESLAKN